MRKTFITLFKNKIFNTMLCGVLITVLFITALCFSYYYKVEETIKEESESYILEISKQLGNNISRNINDNFSALETLAVALNGNKMATFEMLSSQVSSLQEHWKYNEVLVIDKNGSSYDADGNAVRLSNDVYLQNALVGRVPSMSSSELINGEESIIFVIPVEFTIGGTEILGLALTYGLDTFDSVLSMSAFDGKGYAHIIDKSGTLIIRSSSHNAFDPGYNLLNSMEKGKFKSKKMAEVRAEIERKENGFVEFSYDDEPLYLAYITISNSAYFEDWRLMSFVPVADVSNKSTLLLSLTLLLCGLITITFTGLLTIIVIVTIKNSHKLEKIAYIDGITRGNTLQKFRELATRILSNNKDKKYALLYTNINKFKVLNEQYGRQTCDQLLKAINIGISSELESDECMGRLFADNFVIILKIKTKDDFIERVKVWKKAWKEYFAKNNLPNLPFIIEIGIYIVNDNTVGLNQMMDRAKLALGDARPLTDESLRVSLYNDKIGDAIKREKQLEDIMEESLENGEFLVYLQPKYSVETEKINGAEALSRWNNAAEGMIYPNEFIPLFEKNGFIQKLDLFVFESICKTQRKWLDDGFEPVKVSVNCSRAQLKDFNFIEKYVEIVKRNNVPFKYLEIEFTENLVFGDVEYFSKVINRIKEYGFGCSMDDFGSGYSSLSMIQDIPVDTIKLDKVFFEKKAHLQAGRTESVIDSIIKMSKALSITIVAEGIEDKEHVDMLKRLKCDLIQGYYYAKPMPICDFENLAFGTAISTKKEAE